MSFDNKNPGKDISEEDLLSKFPLASKKNKDHKSIIKIAGKTFGDNYIPIMAGPNMVESEEFIDFTGKNLKEIGIDFMRGGAFKPLTFPYRSEKYYETREDGIKWLINIKKKYDIPIITEVMEEKYIDIVSDAADILQIGTRNMQNFPFLTACAKTGKPIMLKRHFGCSLRDWLGAAEYILKEGNNNLLLCERGVVAPHTHRDSSRFLLDLQVVPAAQEITHLPIIVDPSHATFWSPWVKSMTLASIAAGADGIMLEVHPDPKNSAVDPLQPIDFTEYRNLLSSMRKVAESVDRKII